jgi:methyl-accepting chemotaxis protein
MARELKRPRRYREAGKMTEYGLFLVNECSPLRRQIVADINKVLGKVQSDAHQATARVREKHEQSLLWIVALTAGSVAMASVIAMVITRSLLRQLGGEPRYAAGIANQIARGDLTADVKTRAGDGDSLLYAIKLMRDNLSGIVANVRSGTDHIASASTDIASGNTNLALRTKQQTGSLQEVATAMQQLTTSVRGNAGSAAQASVFARSASDISVQGGAVVGQVVDTMELINASSKRIADITSVIDSIAFQTNILALNAAVEAARAGEQGRGFAVVATEVRNLAQRSAAAAREIKGLIDDSVSKVAAGVTLVARAGNTMRDVVDGITSVSVVIAEISRESEAQTRGIDAIDRAVLHLGMVTGQNAALVEAAATASESLKEQATELAAGVDVFKLRLAPVLKVATIQLGSRTRGNDTLQLTAALRPT